MSRITEMLIRKRAEHNNLEIFTLEELSLHQQDIIQIELIEKICRDLKILYLQSNLIGRIENVGRLKKLEYLNLALNNVKRIENLSACESLNKLDLTVNFVSELTSVESLTSNYNLRELFLTGNPCTQYDGYRPFVLATLPQLNTLDGQEIEVSERIQAQQEMSQGLRDRILHQQQEHASKEEQESRQAEIDEQFDPDETEEEREKRFWQQKTAYTPESRLATHEHLKQSRADKDKPEEERAAKPTRRFDVDGRMLNMNEGKYAFTVDSGFRSNNIVVDLALPRFMDLSLIDCDIQPTYLRVTAKDKVFQLVHSEEVQAEASSAKRSQVTGNLVITMPKVKQVVQPARAKATATKQKTAVKDDQDAADGAEKKRELLEVDASKRLDIGNIVGQPSSRKPESARAGRHQTGPGKSLVQEMGSQTTTQTAEAIENDDAPADDEGDFEDDPDVPPLM